MHSGVLARLQGTPHIRRVDTVVRTISPVDCVLPVLLDPRRTSMRPINQNKRIDSLFVWL